MFLEGVNEGGVDFVAVAEASSYGFLLAKEVVGAGSFLEEDVVPAEAHGASFVGDASLFWEDADDVVLFPADFFGVCVFDAALVPCVLDNGELHAVADAQEGRAGRAAVLDDLDFSFHAARSESSRDDDAVGVLQDVFGVLGGGDFARVNPGEGDGCLGMGGAVSDGFGDAGVAVLEFGVFAADGDGDFLRWLVELIDEALPCFVVLGGEPEFFFEDVVEAFFFEDEGDFVDGWYVNAADDCFFGNVAEFCNFFLDAFVECFP